MGLAAKFFAIILIFASLLGGFALEGGSLISLWHPSELLIILGMALGAFLASTPVAVWLRTLMFLRRYFSGDRISKALYKEVVMLMYDLSRFARAEGMLAMEKHLLEPAASPIFAQYPSVLRYPELRDFVASNLNYLLLNPPQSEDFGGLLEMQIDNYMDALQEVPRATGKVSDWLPGFGIVAAVLGVILAMGLLGGDMDVAAIGQAIGAALVGTLTGVFFAFAIVAPFSHAVEVMIRQERALFEMVKVLLEAFEHGVSPNLIRETGKQLVPPELEIDWEK
ncbi:chemotaxis protein MotA [Sulfurivirga caldicuralii]|uniref:Chemotaxis protein MotA n=1 Tax=Sulfurivirga caldicuralii TaxID=364032 RepID=A0A1N6GJW6_9GAMM|nr:motility-associated protein [Sulfurivirga caldicuralii]SIO07806.1 chemotaxis protein MotA [Sulfurivirga caldicuralii]